MASISKGRWAVYLVDLPEGFQPQSVHHFPPVFSGAEAYSRKLPAYAAIGFAVVFNKRQLAERLSDRKWAIPVSGAIADPVAFNRWAQNERETGLSRDVSPVGLKGGAE